VANAGGNEGVAPEVVARIEREIEATAGRCRMTPCCPCVDTVFTVLRFQRLKLKCDQPLSNFAFDFNLRRYTTVDQSDVGISVYKDPVTGKTTYHSDLTGTGLPSTSGLMLNSRGTKQQQAEEEGGEEAEEGKGEAAEEEEEKKINPLPAKLKAILSKRTNADASFLPSLKRSTNWDAAFPPPLKCSMVDSLPKAGVVQVGTRVDSASFQR
jgi:hypothetical protein